MQIVRLILVGKIFGEYPSNRRPGLQSEETPHNTRRFKDYCLLYPTLDPTTKRKLLNTLVEAFREKTTIGTITLDSTFHMAVIS
ncbi:jg4972 [Pararge aegeria aegeria]|uniref:Jg4972 protein n=1 Tax=Pararge aegeria aegeria TaxID=348720 RepID=A0A8S4SEL1_9NEOP|nr:jg4972 [Pararge aegeria aegeria]